MSERLFAVGSRFVGSCRLRNFAGPANRATHPALAQVDLWKGTFGPWLSAAPAFAISASAALQFVRGNFSSGMPLPWSSCADSDAAPACDVASFAVQAS